MIAVLLVMISVAAALPAPGLASTALDLPGCREHTLHRNDDESSELIGLPFEVDFYGGSYDSLYLNNNGNVTFDSPLGTYIPFDLTQTNRVIIAPFFADVDTRPFDGGTVTYGETTFDGRPAFCALWDEVGYFPNATDLRNTFQLLLVRGTPGTGDFNIVFRYASIQWELGSASNGVAARVGFSNGDPARSAELAGSAENGAFLNGGPHALTQGSIGSSTPGTWIFSVRDGTVGNDPRNVPSGFSRDSPWWTWPDQDGDGLPSYWENNGVWVGDRHVNLAGLGADPAQKDAFVYVDVVSGERWNSTIEDLLRSSFGSSPLNIRLHLIRGPRVLGRGEVPVAVNNSDAFFSQMVRLGFTGTGLSGSPGSVPALAKYVCVCPDHQRGGGVGGEANGIKADHLIVTVYEARWLDTIKHQTGISFSNNDLVGDQLNAATTMHELGHLYGLRHHGREHTPIVDHEYLSIMSYAYNALGIPRTPEEALAGKLLPKIDYSRRNVKNLDWRMGGEFGALSLVYGQHGERGNFYSTIEEIPGGEEAPAEAGVDELLADPAIAEQIAKAARDLEAASGTTSAPPSSAPARRGRVTLGKVQVKRGRVLVKVNCDASGPCNGKLEVVLARTRSAHKSARASKQGRGKQPQVVAKAIFALPPASAKTVTMKLTQSGLSRVRRAGKSGLEATLKLDGSISRRLRLTVPRRN